MKKPNLKLVCLSVLAFAAASVAAQGVTSTVNIYGSTSAQANGRDVSAYGQTTIDGHHRSRNGVTNYSGVVGAEGSGNNHTDAQASLMFSEVRGTAATHGVPPQARNTTSNVNTYGTTGASANGRDVLVYGQTAIDGRHRGSNGVTNFSGVVGAEGSGNYHTNQQTSLMWGEERGTTDTFQPYDGGSRTRTSYVNNVGNLSSNAYAADPKTLAWGDMRMNGTLTGPGGSTAKFGNNHGYDAVGTYRADGRSNGYFGQEFRVHVGPHGW